MRIELGNNGYVKTVLFGCYTGECAEYVGEIPAGYSSLMEWADNACINAYYLDSNGNLVLDEARQTELEALYAQQEADNELITRKVLTEALEQLKQEVTVPYEEIENEAGGITVKIG